MAAKNLNPATAARLLARSRPACSHTGGLSKGASTSSLLTTNTTKTATSQHRSRLCASAIAARHYSSSSSSSSSLQAPSLSLSTARLGSSKRPAFADGASIARLRGPGRQTQQTRSIFIQTQDTPNQDALKFLPSTRVLPEGFRASFVEYLSPRSTLAAPHPSPLAAQLLAVDGVTAVFYGPDYVTVTKATDVPWAHVKPEVFSLITEAVTSGQPFVTTKEAGSTLDGQQEAGAEQQDGINAAAKDSLEHDEDDDEVVQMIKELLDTRIRPAIQEDGGDIEYRGFKDGTVMLKLRGACRTCDSSTVTLKNGIENMLMHYIEEVKAVTQVLDEEEEIALQEFAKFEEKLKQQKGEGAVASTGGKGTLDAAEA